MKYFAWMGGFIVALLGVLYVVAFTSFGNSLLQPVIEEKIQEEIKLESKLKTFSLSLRDFEILLKLNEYNTILLIGIYSPFSQAFNVLYLVR